MLGQAISERQRKADNGSEDESSQRSTDTQLLLERLADEICSRRLRLPALIALEAAKPLAFIGGQLLWIGQPVLTLFFPSDVLGQAARLLEDSDAVTSLIETLETRT